MALSDREIDLGVVLANVAKRYPSTATVSRDSNGVVTVLNSAGKPVKVDDAFLQGVVDAAPSPPSGPTVAAQLVVAAQHWNLAAEAANPVDMAAHMRAAASALGQAAEIMQPGALAAAPPVQRITTPVTPLPVTNAAKK